MQQLPDRTVVLQGLFCLKRINQMCFMSHWLHKDWLMTRHRYEERKVKDEFKHRKATTCDRGKRQLATKPITVPRPRRLLRKNAEDASRSPTPCRPHLPHKRFHQGATGRAVNCSFSRQIFRTAAGDDANTSPHIQLRPVFDLSFLYYGQKRGLAFALLLTQFHSRLVRSPTFLIPTFFAAWLKL